jgi:hypothetical protein
MQYLHLGLCLQRRLCIVVIRRFGVANFGTVVHSINSTAPLCRMEDPKPRFITVHSSNVVPAETAVKPPSTYTNGTEKVVGSDSQPPTPSMGNRATKIKARRPRLHRPLIPRIELVRRLLWLGRMFCLDLPCKWNREIGRFETDTSTRQHITTVVHLLICIGGFCCLIYYFVQCMVFSDVGRGLLDLVIFLTFLLLCFLSTFLHSFFVHHSTVLSPILNWVDDINIRYGKIRWKFIEASCLSIV